VKKILFALLIILIFASPAYAAGFSYSVSWNGTDVIITWEDCIYSAVSKPLEFVVTNQTTGETATLQTHKENGSINLSDTNFTNGTYMNPPGENDRVTVKAITPKGHEYTRSVECNEESAVNPELSAQRGPIPIFSERTWPVIMFWYVLLSSLSGVFIFLIIIKSGYQYMFSQTSNPGMRASFTDTLEKCVIAMVVIMTAPLLVGFLIQVNDAFVAVFAKALDVAGSTAIDTQSLNFSEELFGANWLDRMIAGPLKTIFIDLPNTLFGLHPLPDLIFNGQSDVIAPGIFSGYADDGKMLDLGNPLATVIITLAMAGFNLFFNAVYTIRHWVVIAVMVSTPLIVWIWVLSSRRQVIELWLSELFQTIFMQTWHALTFALIISILIFNGNAPDAASVVDFIGQNTAPVLISFGKWIAGFGGIICVSIIVFQAYRLILASDSRAIEETKTKITRALTGLVILALALMITQVLVPESVPVLQPSVTGGNLPKITIWELFWALFAVIPISKMLSYIFMSLLARIGTVDENTVALQGAGMLSGLGALARVSGSAVKGSPGLPSIKADKTSKDTNISSGSGSANPPRSQSQDTSAPNIFDEPSSMKNEEPGIYPGTENHTSPERPETKPAERELFSGNDHEEPGIYPTDVYSPPPKADDNSKNDSEEKYTSFIEQSQEKIAPKGNSLVKAARSSGYLAGSFVGAGEGFSRFFEVGGKVSADALRTFSLGQELYRANKGENKKQTLSNLQDFTGRSSIAGGIAQGLTTTMLAPMGPGYSTNAGIWMGKKMDAVAQKPERQRGIDQY